jgi:hypothetical protein
MVTCKPHQPHSEARAIFLYDAGEESIILIRENAETVNALIIWPAQPHYRLQ